MRPLGALGGVLLAGMVDGPSSSLGKGEKRELLRRYQHAHHTLSADVLSKTRDESHAREHQYMFSTNGLLIQYVEPSLVTITSPPSIMRGIPVMSWEFRADFELEEVITDPSQDLLVAVSRNDG